MTVKYEGTDLQVPDTTQYDTSTPTPIPVETDYFVASSTTTALATHYGYDDPRLSPSGTPVGTYYAVSGNTTQPIMTEFATASNSPISVEPLPTEPPYTTSSGQTSGADDLGCWTAFRTGSYSPISDPSSDSSKLSHWLARDISLPSEVLVRYDRKTCQVFMNSTGNIEAVRREAFSATYSNATCTYRTNVQCQMQGATGPKCRLSIRMQATFILAGCLLIKAAYMTIVNLRARKQVKSRCLTFGDVVVASAMDSGIRIHNECLLNAGDGHRHATDHRCHKHCKAKETSATGDTIGHCQKCKKYNTADRAADLVHPVVAIKFKKALLGNLGS